MELEPAEEIEHIELFLEPKDELFEGLEGGVWKVNPSDFMSLITCSDVAGSLKGSWNNMKIRIFQKVSNLITLTFQINLHLLPTNYYVLFLIDVPIGQQGEKINIPPLN